MVSFFPELSQQPMDDALKALKENSVKDFEEMDELKFNDAK